MNWKMFWLGNQPDCVEELQDQLSDYTMLKNYKVGYRANPRRYYVVSQESAEYVIEQLRKAGYQCLEITNYD
ncbi:hypothetical protein AVV44_gp140 [Cronobacter phage S13]|jgi:hypothetical protein|uniref:Uncharacterized protein n=1 Tax=Cronobacter phage LPCS28 TaxID=2924885 RepID=A0AAE9K7X9_9CAUD|nr:hypothetical protein AVV44_gp140 [Cronobacter phage S13]YP_010665724.1 hypothetical protein PQB73_gp006 [Cronobacter phage LPCS28]AIA64939.1 hypothetical protein S13_140 [Cronobacter phage S13]UNY46913.1 hypothetical protein EHEKIMEA_00006 [Cronobacter phage LPCS28]